MVTQTISVSADSEDLQYLKERRLSASRVFRYAVHKLRAQEMEIHEEPNWDNLLDEIVKLRTVIKAQNDAMKTFGAKQ